MTRYRARTSDVSRRLLFTDEGLAAQRASETLLDSLPAQGVWAERHSKETIMNPSTTSSCLRGPIAAAIFGILAQSLTVVSAADPGSASRTVKFADLNISDPSGAHVLYTRIRVAAQVACSYYWFATDAHKARCVRDATADAVTRINQPALFAVYNAKNKRSVPSSLPSQSR